MGASTVVQQVRLLPVHPTWALVQVLNAPLQIQFPANEPGKAAKMAQELEPLTPM